MFQNYPVLRHRPGIWLLFLVLLPAVHLSAQERRYAFLPGESTLEIHVPRAGLLKAFGHDHLIRAGTLEGHVILADGAAVGRELELKVPVDSLVVADAEVSEKDRRKIEAEMRGQEVLDRDAWPVIRFSASNIRLARSGVWQVTGYLEVRDHTREVQFRAEVAFPAEGRLLASGSVELTPEEFGIEPVSALGGMVRTADVIEIRFKITAQLKQS